MDKIAWKVWFADSVKKANAELRSALNSEGTDPRVKALERFFSTGDLKKSQIRLDAVKTLLADIGMEPINVELGDLNKKIESVRLAIMKVSGGTHTYGTDYFLVSKSMSGYKRNGTLGDIFPESDVALWECVPIEKEDEMISVFLELAVLRTEFRDFMKSIKALLGAFVDFDGF